MRQTTKTDVRGQVGGSHSQMLESWKSDDNDERILDMKTVVRRGLGKNKYYWIKCCVQDGR